MEVALMLLLSLAGGAAAQPAACHEDSYCTTGFYCDPATHYCLECLRCDLLLREPPLIAATSCIKSVSECGLCLEGLVDNPSGNVNAQCVPAGASGAEGPPSYVWVTLAVGLLLVVLIVGLVCYVLRNPETFKIRTSTRTELQSSHGSQDRSPSTVESAPPPYNASAPAYMPVRPTSPPLADDMMPAYYAPGDDRSAMPKEVSEAARPFIKRADSARVRGPRASERDSNQEARVYNYPHYVRAPELPPSYDSSVNAEESSPEPQPDEETVESPWTPAEDPAHAPNSSPPAPAAPGSARELSALLNEARGTTLVRDPRDPRDSRDPWLDHEPTPSKQLCIRQDSNNNKRTRLDAGEGTSSDSGGSSGGGAGPAHPPASHPHPPLTFNITVQQHNDLKLIRT